MLHPAEMSVEQLLTQCDVRRQRRSGPGGQHRNKVETAVVVTHRPSGCLGEASERRSQEQNRQMAIARLRVNLAITVRNPRGQAPSERWKRRCQGGRLKISVQHEDFATLLAEALDSLAQQNWDVASAANHLDCTTSQLVKLLKLEHRALQQLNDARKQQGLSSLL